MATNAITKRKSQAVELSVPALTPLDLLHQAIEQGVDLDKMQKLMDMQDQWERKQAKKAFLDALAWFQSVCPEIKKSRKADIRSMKGNYSYMYAPLGSITAQIRQSLKECGLSYRWEFQDVDGKLKVTCFLSHRDGHTETTTMEAGRDASGGKNDIQQIGSTQTYLQRYTLIGALGLSTAEDDDDGHNNPTTKQPQPVLTEEEMLNQWQQSVNGVSTRAALKSLYLSNRKAVDSNAKVQAIFKAREDELPVTPKTELP